MRHSNERGGEYDEPNEVPDSLLRITSPLLSRIVPSWPKMGEAEIQPCAGGQRIGNQLQKDDREGADRLVRLPKSADVAIVDGDDAPDPTSTAGQGKRRETGSRHAGGLAPWRRCAVEGAWSRPSPAPGLPRYLRGPGGGT
jgi:hypothetical protein